MQWRSYKLDVFLGNKMCKILENSDFAELYKMFNETFKINDCKIMKNF